MNDDVDIDERMKQFRLASREIFNRFFHIPEPYENDGWLLEERFSDLQVLLFEKLVSEPAKLSTIRYGIVQNEIAVTLSSVDVAPIMINRDVDSGYWDYPVKEVTKEASLFFVCFFDWDQLDCRDNQYVRVQIDRWPAHPDAVGRHALIESRYVRFLKPA